MPNLTLRAMKAKHGDCLFLFAEGATVLIDGGPSGVYNQVLRDQLLDLPTKDDDTPVIDLLMVSHIDADHIDGVLDLTAELIEAREEESDPIAYIRGAWHNSFADAIAQGSTKTKSSTRGEAASLASTMDEMNLDGFDPHDSKLVLASVGQGRQLRLDLKALNIVINKQFKDRLVLLGNEKTPWKRGELSLKVIGPTQKQIDKLRKKWEKDLKKILAKEADAQTAALSLDTSVSNLASIVAIAEAGGKTILLTGDARGDMIIEWLEETGHMKAGGKVHFDVIKQPHHASARNISKEFFERITADHYVMSGDGKHGNPDPLTFELLFEARPKLDYTVHMTYSPDEMKEHKEFKKDNLIADLDAVLEDPKRKAILKYPDTGDTYLDISI